MRCRRAHRQAVRRAGRRCTRRTRHGNGTGQRGRSRCGASRKTRPLETVPHWQLVAAVGRIIRGFPPHRPADSGGWAGASGRWPTSNTCQLDRASPSGGFRTGTRDRGDSTRARRGQNGLARSPPAQANSALGWSRAQLSCGVVLPGVADATGCLLDSRCRGYGWRVLMPGVWSAWVNSTNSASSSMCTLCPGRMW